jgi:hypothetical protein
VVRRAVYSIACVSAGRVVSGKVPAAAQKPYHSAEFYQVAGHPDFAAAAAAGAGTCNVAAVTEGAPEQLDPISQVFAAVVAACPGLLVLGDTAGDLALLSPEEALVYNCSEVCAEWVANFGICAATPLQSEVQQLHEATAGLDPPLMVPPSCWVRVSQMLAARGGGVYRLLEAPPLDARRTAGSQSAQSGQAAAPQTTVPAATAAAPAACLPCACAAAAAVLCALMAL